MANGFPQKDVDELLVKCHRRCCICHRFCGVKIETDHIIPRGQDGPDSIDNAIALCFECHAEIHSYNDKHPRGRKFHPNELSAHKEQWLEICRNKPATLLAANRSADVGPLQALIDELEFNMVVSQQSTASDLGCLFLDEQFRRAIREGAISVLNEDLKQLIIEAYVAMGNANQLIYAMSQIPRGSNNWLASGQDASNRVAQARDKIQTAKEELIQFFASE
jgi:hypothetical protein